MAWKISDVDVHRLGELLVLKIFWGVGVDSLECRPMKRTWSDLKD